MIDKQNNDCPLDGAEQQKSCSLHEHLVQSGEVHNCPYQSECRSMLEDNKLLQPK